MHLMIKLGSVENYFRHYIIWAHVETNISDNDDMGNTF